MDLLWQYMKIAIKVIGEARRTDSDETDLNTSDLSSRGRDAETDRAHKTPSHSVCVYQCLRVGEKKK